MALPGQISQSLTTTATINRFDVDISVASVGTVQTGQTVYYDTYVLGTIFDVDAGNNIILNVFY